MATVTVLTPAELRDEVEELLKLATEKAELEERIERKAEELQHSDVDGAPYLNAMAGQIRGLTQLATQSEDETLDLCTEIQELLDIVNLAVERDESRTDN